MLEERVTDARSDLVRMDVEVGEPVALDDRNPAAEDVRLALTDAAAEERQALLVRVELREEVEQRERGLDDSDDLLDVVRGRSADHEP
jgi:hypothetical protein